MVQLFFLVSEAVLIQADSLALLLWVCPPGYSCCSRAAVMALKFFHATILASPQVWAFFSFDQPTQAGSGSPVKNKFYGGLLHCASGLQLLVLLHLKRPVFPCQRCFISKNNRAPQMNSFPLWNHWRGWLPVLPPGWGTVWPWAPAIAPDPCYCWPCPSAALGPTCSTAAR